MSILLSTTAPGRAFGSALKRARRAARLTTGQLAGELGLPMLDLFDIEVGQRPCPRALLLDIFTLLTLPIPEQTHLLALHRAAITEPVAHAMTQALAGMALAHTLAVAGQHQGALVAWVSVLPHMDLAAALSGLESFAQAAVKMRQSLERCGSAGGPGSAPQKFTQGENPMEPRPRGVTQILHLNVGDRPLVLGRFRDVEPHRGQGMKEVT